MARILYVDDNPSNLKLLQAMLTFRPGVDLITATGGRAGLDAVRSERPDVVLLDLHLPDMRGDEVLDRLTEDPSTSAIPVVVVSAEDDRQVAHETLARGAHAYVTKPFEMHDLLGLIDKLLGTESGEGS